MKIGRYELISKLTTGGMGELFIARTNSGNNIEKRVALKLLLPHLADRADCVQMFLDEARLASRMNHPNVVQIFDVGVADNRYYLAMELVEGASLARLIRACRQAKEHLPLPLVRLIGIGLCEGLAHAHGLTDKDGQALHVVHRDVNPANVLISTSGAVRLTDFGIARANDNNHQTEPGKLRGKFAYLAPEQLTGKHEVDARTDIFSGALTLYEALTLHAPFRKDSDAQTLYAVSNEPIADPRTLRPEVPEVMVAALTRALSRAPEARFASARTLRDALMDGPIAQPHELGQWVTRLCSEELSRFGGAQRLDVTRTAGGLSEPPPVVSTRRQRRRAPLAAALVVVTITVVVAALMQALPLTLPLFGHSDAPLVMASAAVPAPVVETPPTAPVPDAKIAPPVMEPQADAATSRRATAARPRVGYLTMQASPWGRVYLDGAELGLTPISRHPVRPGLHTLLFKSPSGEREEVVEVNIEKGKVETVRVDFKP